MPRNSWRSEALLVALTFVPVFAGAQARPVESLRWLSGCWERRTPTAYIEEQWSSTAGGMLVGFAKTTVRDSVREYEFVRISAVGDTLVYHAQPSRQQPAEFRAAPPYDSVVTFSNPAHDFPQRVAYRRVGADSIVARIEGTRGGQARTISFPFRRVACPTG